MDRSTKTDAAALRRKSPDIVILDASDPDIEQRIGEHIFKGIAFALDYESVPADRRDALQEAHVAAMKTLQDLARQRYATTLN